MRETATSNDVDLWLKELKEAGWRPMTSTIWRSPTGKLFLGPYGAWKWMKAGVAEGRE